MQRTATTQPSERAKKNATRRERAIAFLLLLLAPACSSDGVSGDSSGAGGVFAAGGATSNPPFSGGAAGAPVVPSGSGGARVGSGGSVIGPGGSVSGNSGGQFNGGGAGAGGAAGTAGSAGAAGATGGAAGNGGGGAAGGGNGGAAGASGAAGGGAGGTGQYSPCPKDATPCKILPLGDSITYGLGVSDNSSYRVELFKKARAAGKHITYVGSLMSGPTMVDGVTFPRNNEGHSGWTIDQVAGLIPSPALTDNPDIILLIVGTNDMYMGMPGTAPQRLKSLLDKIIGVSAHPLIVVAKITPLSSGSMAVETYNAALPPIVDALAAAGKHVALVDLYTGFSTTMLADGVHPNAAGYAQIAGVWYTAIQGILN